MTEERLTKIQFWEGFEGELGLAEISRSAVPVKGKIFSNPLRFMEIYCNCDWTFERAMRSRPPAMVSGLVRSHPKSRPSGGLLKSLFIPKVPGVSIGLDADVYLPPYRWKECDAKSLCVNFTYNTNAFYRILSNLLEEGKIPAGQMASLLDQACTILAAVYKDENHYFIQNINNNFNMYLISRVIEILLGKHVYDSEKQELNRTRSSLRTAIDLSRRHVSYSVMEKMGVALGKGVCFIERYLVAGKLTRSREQDVRDVANQYFQKDLAIDHRRNFLAMIESRGLKSGSFLLGVVLDDAAETVDDLLWIMDLLTLYPFLKARIVVNRAQISINFSSRMLQNILMAEHFSPLAALLGGRFLVTEIYCPFISFQENFLPAAAKDVIAESDAVYIKGANFFETCQLPEKETFYAFVVLGPVSRKYTGLRDYDAVFAYVPKGYSGYVHSRDPARVVTLAEVCSLTTVGSGSSSERWVSA